MKDPDKSFEEIGETINRLNSGERGHVEKLYCLDKWSRNTVEIKDVEKSFSVYAVKCFGEVDKDDGSCFISDLAFLKDSANSKNLW